jgi:serine/threonine-protein kinase RsbW
MHAPTFSKKIPSLMTEADSLCLEIRAVLQPNDLSKVSFPIELLARECLANAVIHGNKNDADKSIVVCMWVDPNWICLRVSDEGPGFGWRKARQSQLDTSACSGRGLQLYQMYAKRVQFNRCGNQITLWFTRKILTGEEKFSMAAYVCEQKDGLGSVRLTGDLTAVLVPELQAGLKKLLESGASDLVFDLSSTAMLDSSGMGLLIAAANSVAGSGGKVRVTNVSPDIFRLLQSMRLVARLNVSGRAE